MIGIGVLNDVTFGSPTEVLERAVMLGIEDVRRTPQGASLPDIDLVTVSVEAHPVGSPAAAATGLRDLAEAGVVAVIGPAISDNALACQPVADELQLCCINWSGSERTRSEWMFHFQVGSLEDEPFVIAEYLVQRGWRQVAVVREDSVIGRNYASFFQDAAVVHGIEILGVIDLDVHGTRGSDAAAALEGLAPEAVVFLGFPSVAGFAAGMKGRTLPVISNSALIGGGTDVEGWPYIDVFDETNTEWQRFRALWPDAPPNAGPTALFDMARLMTYGLSHAPTLDRAGIRVGLERVKRVPAAIGEPGTIAGFGQWKRAALEGGYLVLRQWHDGRSVRVR